MLEIFQKNARKAGAIRILIVALIIAGVQVFTGGAIVSYIMGPQKLDASSDMDTYKGKYVTYDTNFVLFAYVDNLNVDEDSRRETHVSSGYVVADADSGNLFAIEVGDNNMYVVDNIVNQTYDYLDGVTDDEPESITVTGSFKMLEGQELTYFNQIISEAFGEDTSEYTIPYVITNGEINGTSINMMLGLNALCAAALIYGVYIFIRILTRSSDMDIRKYLDINPTISLSHIEADFAAAEQIGKNIWIGKRWTFHPSGIYFDILENDKVIWAYYFQRSGRYSESKMMLHMLNKTTNQINISAKNSTKFLENFEKYQPQVILGYDKSLKKTHKKDFDTFLTYKYNNAMNETQKDLFDEMNQKYNLPEYKDTEEYM